MAKIDGLLMKAKFRGSMLGSLLGDCFGGPFEGDSYSYGMKLTVQNCFEKLDGPAFKAPFKPYSDDTAMTKSVAKCLINKPAVDYNYMARLFVDEYYRDPNRCYGANVVEVFYKLKMHKFENVHAPAKEQFQGRGSYGNGGAMRVAPIPLYFHNNFDGLVDAVRKSTTITHTNPLGINGALLQAFAIYQSLHLHPEDTLDPLKFTMDLIEKMKEFEVDHDHEEDKTPYQTQLKLLLEFLKVKNPENPISIEEVMVGLGNTVAALYSVPTAIYCFLKAHSGFAEIQCENVFRRAVQYAVTLGGDTDTIAAMTGAIAGAYFGEEGISKSMISHCEKPQEIIEMADNLYNASMSLDLDKAQVV